MPNRGAAASAGHLKFVSVMPCPDWNRPLVRFPELGTIAPIASVVFGPRNWPVTGFMAWRFVPVHGDTPFAQPAT